MHVGVLRTGRHDWGILSLLVDALKAEQVGITVFDQSGHTVATAGAVYDHLRQSLAVDRLDALILLGDRYETLHAALAATVARVPIIHLHGGEVTKGAFDDQIRNAITMMADLHLVASEDAKARVLRMGGSNVHLVGAIGTDWAFRPDLPTKPLLEALLGKRLKDPVMLVCIQPETAGVPVEQEAVKLGRENPGTTVYFLPNLDPGNEAVRDAILKAPREQDILVDALPARDYWGLMRAATRMVGNSSSIVLEAPTIGLETVLLGKRQEGRVPPIPADGKAAERAAQAILSWLQSRTRQSRQAV